MKKLPYGISNYEGLKELEGLRKYVIVAVNDKVYVDEVK